MADTSRYEYDYERAIADHYGSVLEEPIPPRLLGYSHCRSRRWWTRVGIAASVILAAASGWWLGNQQAGTPSPGRFAERVAAVAAGRADAAAVSSDASRADAKAPDLSGRGYALVARRVVRNTPRLLTELVYENTTGKRVRVYAQPRHPLPPVSPSVSRLGGTPLAQWHTDNMDYALVADMPAASLQALARTAAKDDAPGASGAWEDNRAPAAPVPSESPARVGVLPAAGAPAAQPPSEM